MTKVASFILACCAFCNAAYADDFNHDIKVYANVVKSCSFNGEIFSDAVFSGVGNSNSTFNVNVDSSTSKVALTHGTLTFSSAFCNTPSNVTLSRSGLALEGTAPLGFTKNIDYGVELRWASGTPLVSLVAGGENSSGPGQIGPVEGSLDITLKVDPMDNPARLIPGEYEDHVIISVIPQ